MIKVYRGKLVAATLLVICLMPLFISSTLGFNDDVNQNLSINEEFDKIHKLILFKRGTIGNIASFDTYHFQMKEGKTYYFRAKINIDAGAFTFGVSGPGGSAGELPIWDEDDPASAHVAVFTFTPTADGDHSITIGSVIATDGGTYTLYVNKDGFAGWWWMLAIGVGAILIIVIFAVAIRSRGKKSKRRRRR